MIEGILTGLRIGAIILWAWVALRILLESWHITEAPLKVRQKGWTYWRAMVLVTAFVIVFLFSPENILRAHNYITEDTGYMMMAGGVIGLHFAAYLTMMGLDVATEHKNRALPAYIGVSAVSLVYGITAGAV